MDRKSLILAALALAVSAAFVGGCAPPAEGEPKTETKTETSSTTPTPSNASATTSTQVATLVVDGMT